MSAFARLRSVFNRAIAPTGFSLARPHELAAARQNHWTMEKALARIACLGIRPASVIDLGAGRGEWSRLAYEVFPDADYALVEPLAERAAELATFCQKHPRMRHVPAAAGAAAGQTSFDVSADLDGSGIYSAAAPNARRVVSVRTVDEIVQALGLQPPFLLKLDTHGYELPIFAGATRTLADTTLLVVEVYNFQLSSTTVRFWELCAWLHEHGFLPADLAGLMDRPRDGLFWQTDLLFLRSEHPSFAVSSYA